MSQCCYISSNFIVDTSDPCVCNMPGGGTLVLANGQIWIRTTVTVPCNSTDWEIIDTNIQFFIEDSFLNSLTVGNLDTIQLFGDNGIITEITGSIITIHGNSTYGSGPPASSPISPYDLQVNIYVDCLNQATYFWCPSTLSWIGPFNSVPINFIDSDTIVWSYPGGNVQADIINHPSGGLTSNTLGELIKKDIVTNSNDNTLQLSTNGAYVTPAARQLATLPTGIFNPNLPTKVVQNQSGTPTVIDHYNVPSASIRIKKVGINLTAYAVAFSTQILDILTYSWNIFPSVGVTIVSPTASITDITFTNSGTYTIQLDVNNSAGFGISLTKEVYVDRVLYVGGTNSEDDNYPFTTLQGAYNWINANDLANATDYTIYINSVTKDLVRIIPNEASVFFNAQGKLNVGVDFGAGRFEWNGTGNANTDIESSSVNVITLATNARVNFNNMFISGNLTIGNVFNLATNSTLNLDGCRIFGTTLPTTTGIISTNNSVVLLNNTTLIVSNVGIDSNFSNLQITNSKIEITGSIGLNAIGINSIRSFGFVQNTKIRMNGNSGGDAFGLFLVPNNAGQTLLITNNTIETVNTIPGFINVGLSVVSSGQQVIILNNSIHSRDVGILIPIFTPSTAFRLANNYISGLGGGSIVSNATATSPIVPNAVSNFPAFNNVLNGLEVGPITFANATLLANTNSHNVRV